MDETSPLSPGLQRVAKAMLARAFASQSEMSGLLGSQAGNQQIYQPGVGIVETKPENDSEKYAREYRQSPPIGSLQQQQMNTMPGMPPPVPGAPMPIVPHRRSIR